MSELTPYGKIITGYKATDKNMQCRGFQFEIGKWYEHEGELSLCESGFHFCEYQSGTWSYYNKEGTRIFKCEAELVLLSKCPGADLKHVAKRIRLIDEIKFTGDRNTGDRNTGDCNTGDMNTGYSNTGDMNTGYSNTGDRNTGHRNTGHSNTGDRNTGHSNTGDRNTGHWNTGDRNTGYSNTGERNTGHSNTGDMNTGHWNIGDRNTGDWNTGDRNTGNGNAGDNHSGYFNIGKAPFMVFGVKTDREKFNFSLANELSELLSKDDVFNYKKFLDIPNSTLTKIKKLHQEHIRLRALKNGKNNESKNNNF